MSKIRANYIPDFPFDEDLKNDMFFFGVGSSYIVKYRVNICVWKRKKWEAYIYVPQNEQLKMIVRSAQLGTELHYPEE